MDGRVDRRGVTLPLLFVAGKRQVPACARVAAVLVDIPIEWAGKALFGLPGVAAGLAVTTVLVLGALLAALSSRRSSGSRSG